MEISHATFIGYSDRISTMFNGIYHHGMVIYTTFFYPVIYICVFMQIAL